MKYFHRNLQIEVHLKFQIVIAIKLTFCLEIGKKVFLRILKIDYFVQRNLNDCVTHRYKLYILLITYKL
jgi:hypothetical protein